MFLIYGHLDYFAVSPTQISWNFLKIQLVPAQASGLAMFFFWFEDIQTLPSSQASVENLPFGHRYNILGA